MKKLLLSALSCLLILVLCGCYRQTTVILQQGATVPEATIGVPSVVEETTVPVEAAEQTVPSTSPAETKKPSSGKAQQSGSKDAETETTAPVTEPVTLPAEASPATAPPDSTAQAGPESETTAAPTETTEPAPTQPPVYDISNHSVGSYEKALLEEVNRHRADAGLPALTMNSKLAALAAIRAYECKQDFSHTRPDGRDWDTVLSDYGASASAENILYASSGTDAALLVDTCMDSDSHSQKLLNADYCSIGIGIYDTGRYVYIVMIFS